MRATNEMMSPPAPMARLEKMRSPMRILPRAAPAGVAPDRRRGSVGSVSIALGCDEPITAGWLNLMPGLPGDSSTPRTSGPQSAPSGSGGASTTDSLPTLGAGKRRGVADRDVRRDRDPVGDPLLCTVAGDAVRHPPL